MSDKRHFHRVKLDIEGVLSHQAISVPVTVKDISLQGIRLSASEASLQALPFDSHIPYTASFRLNKDSPLITLDIEQLYRQTDSRHDEVMLGCRVARGDIDSVSALRRLIELNSRDMALSDSDLDALVDAIYSRASSA
ncbi:PilZ domain-containing protein [Alteromonas sp. CYL-A6]|uniref:PilZ domain-containing protein n=1 Tax=Alteromonas nitratireducens TaxID=3390813 RepID=UPI0034BCE60D